jgi:hypothetical protein
VKLALGAIFRVTVNSLNHSHEFAQIIFHDEKFWFAELAPFRLNSIDHIAFHIWFLIQPSTTALGRYIANKGNCLRITFPGENSAKGWGNDNGIAFAERKLAFPRCR